MSVSAAAACMVVLNQQREQAMQHHKKCDHATIVPCNLASIKRTIVENGKVVVEVIPTESIQSCTDPSTEA